MKKIIISPGGQPIRPDDFAMIQDEALKSSFEIIKGLCDGQSLSIVTGLVLTNNGNGTHTLSAGYFFDGQELCAVSALTYTDDVSKDLYLVLQIVNSDVRIFFNQDQSEVVTERNYVPQYVSSQPANSVRYADLSRLSGLLSVTPNPIDFKLTYSGYLAFGSGFSSGDSCPGVYVLTNAYGDAMIFAAFNSSVSNGTIATIPPSHRPARDIIGQFYTGSEYKFMVIRTTGAIELRGVSTSQVNYIQFQFNINADFPPVTFSHL